MKSEERHQLQQNELADWLSHSSERLRRYGMIALVVVVVAVVGGIGYVWYESSVATTRNEAWTEFFAAQNPEDFEQLITRYKGTPAALYAARKLADIRYFEGAGQLADNRSAAMEKLEEALRHYQSLANDVSAPQDVREQAELGVAMTLESQGQVDEAQSAFQSIASKYAGSTTAQIAENQLKSLSRPDAGRFYTMLASYRAARPSTDLPPDPAAPPAPPLDMESTLDGAVPAPPSFPNKVEPLKMTTPTDTKAAAEPPKDGVAPKEPAKTDATPKSEPSTKAPAKEEPATKKTEAPAKDAPSKDSPKAP